MTERKNPAYRTGTCTFQYVLRDAENETRLTLTGPNHALLTGYFFDDRIESSRVPVYEILIEKVAELLAELPGGDQWEFRYPEGYKSIYDGWHMTEINVLSEIPPPAGISPGMLQSSKGYWLEANLVKKN